MNQNELAELIGVTRNSIARAEQGKTLPRRANLIAIAFATGVSLEWLQGGEGPGTQETPAGNEPGGGSDVRHQGLEPRTHCLTVLGPHAA